jgi:hypothetical protein
MKSCIPDLNFFPIYRDNSFNVPKSNSLRVRPEINALTLELGAVETQIWGRGVTSDGCVPDMEGGGERRVVATEEEEGCCKEEDRGQE